MTENLAGRGEGLSEILEQMEAFANGSVATQSCRHIVGSYASRLRSEIAALEAAARLPAPDTECEYCDGLASVCVECYAKALATASAQARYSREQFLELIEDLLINDSCACWKAGDRCPRCRVTIDEARSALKGVPIDPEPAILNAIGICLDALTKDNIGIIKAAIRHQLALATPSPQAPPKSLQILERFIAERGKHEGEHVYCCTNGGRCIKCEEAYVKAESTFDAEMSKALTGFKCQARRGADPPQDCDWPVCGCDPYANKVIEALEESGATSSQPIPLQDFNAQFGSDIFVVTGEHQRTAFFSKEKAEQYLAQQDPERFRIVVYPKTVPAATQEQPAVSGASLKTGDEVLVRGKVKLLFADGVVAVSFERLDPMNNQVAYVEPGTVTPGSPRKVGEDGPEQLMTATGPVSLADFSRNLADDIYAISDGAAPDRETLRAMIRARLEVGLKYWKWERLQMSAAMGCGCETSGETIRPCERHLAFWRKVLATPPCIGYPDCDGDLEGEEHSEKCIAARSSSVPVGEQKQEEGV